MPSTADSTTRNLRIRRVLAGILIANLFVVTVKFIVGVASGSLAVFGDAMQSAVDAVNNIVGLAIVGVASKGPDAEHPYGHAKFETLGALLIVVFLSVSIFELLRGALVRLFAGASAPEIDTTAFALIGITLLVNIAVAAGEARAGRRLGSELLLADAMHTRMDVYITLAVLGGLGLSRAGYGWADPVLAIIVAGFVARTGYEIVRRAMPTLVDERAYDAATIRGEAERIGGVRAAYAIRSRIAASARFAELTIAVDGGADVASAHRIADQVELRLRDELRIDEVVVHVEPC
ncbi:MAG TPA: cation diffusion facilitator family transporter [Gemmatimonadales bacterium]|nr:cation diffusion facilitator family transporter [Gemmatimonadales bacterium]